MSDAELSSDGFETEPQRLRRLLRTRPAQTPFLATLERTAHLFRADDYPQQLAEAAAGAQSAVTTGRRIAVVGSRGGAGKTTVAALLARIYAALRADAVAAVDASPEAGTLTLRLGLEDAPSVDDVGRGLGGHTPANYAALASRLGSVEANLLATGRRVPVSASSTGNGIARAQHDGDATAALQSISRFCPLTILDCGTGLGLVSTRWAVDQAHAGVFVTPATVAGLEDAHSYGRDWSAAGRSAVPLLVVVVCTDARAPVDAAVEAKRLTRQGIAAMHLPYDRHLAAGVELDRALLAPDTRLQATAIASRVLLGAIGTGPA